MKRRKTSMAVAPDADIIIQEVMNTNHVSFSEAIHFIVRKYNEQNSQSLVIEVAEILKRDLKRDLTRIRLGTNNADKNSQIMLEILNTMLFHSREYRMFASTEKDPQDGFMEAKNVVQKRIQAFKTKHEEAKAMKGE